MFAEIEFDTVIRDEQENPPRPPGAGPGPLTSILDREDLRRLREGFDEEVLLRSARSGIGQKIPDSLEFISTLEAQFYQQAPGQSREQYEELARQRESQLVTLFMVHSRGQGFFLGIHFYWGLMMGLSPSQLVRQVLLVGMYGGIQILNAGQMTLELTLQFLKNKAVEGRTRTEDILPGVATLVFPRPNGTPRT